MSPYQRKRGVPTIKVGAIKPPKQRSVQLKLPPSQK